MKPFVRPSVDSSQRSTRGRPRQPGETAPWREDRQMKRFARIAALVAAAGIAGTAAADFSGQTILGPLANGSDVVGDNSNSTDDNDGFTSGMHIFDIWDGGDDVWLLNWNGGPMTVTMTYDNSFLTDVDLFVYRGNVDDSGDYSIINTGIEVVTINNAAAGAYYIVADSTAGTEGEYRLVITPAPGALAVLGIGSLAATRRRRA